MNRITRYLSLLLATVLTFSSMNLTALAAEIGSREDIAVEDCSQERVDEKTTDELADVFSNQQSVDDMAEVLTESFAQEELVGDATGPYTYKIKFDSNLTKLREDNSEAKVTGVMAPMTVKAGERVALTTNAYKAGNYIFMGWSKTPVAVDGAADFYNKNVISHTDFFASVDDISVDGSSEVTLYAVWLKTMSITYCANGGTVSSLGTKRVGRTVTDYNGRSFTDKGSSVYEGTYNYGEAFDLPVPTMTGYVFNGWYYYDAVLKRAMKLSSISKTTAKYYTLSASWTPVKYTIIFDANAGGLTDAVTGRQARATGRVLNLSMSFDKDAKAPACGYSIPGYKFDCWEDESGNTYNPGDDLLGNMNDQANAKVKIFANWVPAVGANCYKITKNLNGGSLEAGDAAVVDHEYGTDTFLQAPVREGYKFEGWYSDTSLLRRITSKKVAGVDQYYIAKTVSGDTNVYAKWSANYQVIFDKNGASSVNTMPNESMAYQTVKALTRNAYKKEGYAFMGWATSAGGDVVYQDCERIVAPALTGDGTEENPLTLKLYAVWQKDFTITLNYKDGRPDGALDYQYGEAKPLPKPTREGYDFAGWYTTDTYKVRATDITKTSKISATYYAKWTPKVYTINFVSNAPKEAGRQLAATGRTASIRVAYDKPFAVPNNGYAVKGRVFDDAKGWNTKDDGNGNKIINTKDSEGRLEPLYVSNLIAKGAVVSSRNIINLYAAWKNEPYNVVLAVYGGTIDSDDIGNPAYGKGDLHYVSDADHDGLKYYLMTYDYSITNEVAIPAPVPGLSGYRFAGWYADSAYKKPVRTPLAKGTDQHYVLYAKWVAVK